jgi:hypothetical protein
MEGYLKLRIRTDFVWGVVQWDKFYFVAHRLGLDFYDCKDGKVSETLPIENIGAVTIKQNPVFHGFDVQIFNPRATWKFQTDSAQLAWTWVDAITSFMTLESILHKKSSAVINKWKKYFFRLDSKCLEQCDFKTKTPVKQFPIESLDRVMLVQHKKKTRFDVYHSTSSEPQILSLDGLEEAMAMRWVTVLDHLIKHSMLKRSFLNKRGDGLVLKNPRSSAPHDPKEPEPDSQFLLIQTLRMELEAQSRVNKALGLRISELERAEGWMYFLTQCWRDLGLLMLDADLTVLRITTAFQPLIKTDRHEWQNWGFGQRRLSDLTFCNWCGDVVADILAVSKMTVPCVERECHDKSQSWLLRIVPLCDDSGDLDDDPQPSQKVKEKESGVSAVVVMLMDLRNNGHFLPSRAWLMPRKFVPPDNSGYLCPVLTLDLQTNAITCANPLAQALFGVPSEDRLLNLVLDELLDLDLKQACIHVYNNQYERLLHVLTCARCGSNADLGRAHPRTYQAGRLPLAFSDMSLRTFERGSSADGRKLVTITFGPTLRGHDVLVFLEEQVASMQVPQPRPGPLRPRDPTYDPVPKAKQIGFNTGRPGNAHTSSPTRPQQRNVPLLVPYESQPPVRNSPIHPPRRYSPSPGRARTPDSPTTTLANSLHFPMDDDTRSNHSDMHFQDSPEGPSIDHHVTHPRGQYYNPQREGERFGQSMKLPELYTGRMMTRTDEQAAEVVSGEPPADGRYVFEPDVPQPIAAQFIADPADTADTGDDELTYY